MIDTICDVMIWSEAEFERLPNEGLWEVVAGKAILSPPNDVEHQDLSDAMVGMFREQLKVLKGGFAFSTPNVFIPRRDESYGGFQSRVPDIVASKLRPKRHLDNPK